jgi:hypothetical protein
MDEPVIKPLSMKQAAARLGRSEQWTRELAKTGKLRPVVRAPSLRVLASDVEQLRLVQRGEAIADFVARSVDVVKLARDTRRQLRPGVMDPGTGGETALARLPSKVRDFFGPAALTALALGDPAKCGWCDAQTMARMLKVPAPEYGETMHALLGDPCRGCMGPFAAGELARLGARVHAGAVRPSGGRLAPSVAPRPATPQKAAAAPVQRSVSPMSRPAAPVVLAAALSAAGVASTRYEGRARCGHLLAERCACPRTRAVTASAAPGTPRSQHRGQR